MKNIIILRGSANAGKSTVANLFPEPKVICCADDYFTDEDGNYNFNPSLLGAAHSQCREKFDNALEDDTIKTVVVANTNTQLKEFKHYFDAAKEGGHVVFSLVVERRHENDNNHNVPEEAILRQANNIRDSLQLI